MTTFANKVAQATRLPVPAQTDKPVDVSKTEYVPFGESRKIALSINIVRKLLCKPTRSGRLCSNEDALRFIAQCQARALNPFLGDAYLVGYDSGKTGQPEFSIITSVNVFYKRAEASAAFDGMESGVICLGENGDIRDFPGDFYPPGWKPIGGYAVVHKKERSKPTVSRLRIEAYQKQNEFWTKDAAGMIVKCAEVDALRRAFPSNSPGLALETAISSTDLGATLPANEAEPAQIQAPPQVVNEPSDLEREQMVKEDRARRRAPEPPAPAPQAAQGPSEDDDGDLGPVSPESASQDEAAPEIGQKQAQVAKWMTDAGVSFDDFASYLANSGLLRTADSLPSWAEVPDNICDAVMERNWRLAQKINTIYRSNKEVA